ncbi:MAG TPA: hypothetical protein VMW43_12765 [Bacteroidota bacterium]|nr:hypothetical protein [Bacteroidota bacterium]
MGQQQLLLLILGVIIVGISIGVGVTQFMGNHEQANRDAVTAKLIGIAADAYHYKLRPSAMGGGSQSYIGYAIPGKLTKDDNGLYTIGTVSTGTVQLMGTSALNTAWIATCTVDDTGTTVVSYSGW